MDGDSVATIGNGIAIRKSMIPQAGRGAFVTRPFKYGEYVTEYDGEVISISEARQRRIDGYATHIRSISPLHTAIDGMRVPVQTGRGAASFINDPRGIFRYNCKFVVTHTVMPGLNRTGLTIMERVFARAICDISSGDELYVGYGTGYEWN